MLTKPQISQQKQRKETSSRLVIRPDCGPMSRAEALFYFIANSGESNIKDMSELMKIKSNTLTRSVNYGCSPSTAHRLRKAYEKIMVFNHRTWVSFKRYRGWAKGGGAVHAKSPRFIMWECDARVEWIGLDQPRTHTHRFDLLMRGYALYHQQVPKWFSVMDRGQRWVLHAYEPRCLVDPIGQWHWIDEPSNDPEELLHMMKGYQACF